MTEEIKNKRDEIAKAYGLDLYPIQNIETRKDFTQDINFARRMTHTKAYQHGFDAGFAIGLEQAKVLAEAIYLYKNNPDFSDANLYQALKEFKEKVGHE